MGDLEKQETVLLKKAAEETAEGEEKERLLEGSGMAVVDFDLLCSTVAFQTQGKLAAKLQSFPREEEDGDAGDLGGVFRCGKLKSLIASMTVVLLSNPSVAHAIDLGRT